MPSLSAEERLPRLDIDWDGVEDEARDLLQRYLRIDTTNPPGGEEAGAALLAEAMGREGITPTFYDAGDGITEGIGAIRVEVEAAGSGHFVHHQQKNHAWQCFA